MSNHIQVGDSVRSLTDPHGRSLGTVVEIDPVRKLARVRWSGWPGIGKFEMAFLDELRKRDDVRREVK